MDTTLFFDDKNKTTQEVLNTETEKSEEKKLAVALKYDKTKIAPFVVSKGKDFLANQIYEIAKKNNIPIVQDSSLVKVLSVVEIGTTIPENTYKAVATIFSFLETINDSF